MHYSLENTRFWNVQIICQSMHESLPRCCILQLPFFSYRISQFHLFYFTTFYPLVVYTFIKLLQTEKKDVLRWCIFFALTLFFGITSPHSILYYGLTLLVLFIAHVSKNQWSLKLFRDSVIRMIIAGGMVVVTNLYWLIPYVIEKAPAPGYVVSTDMITFLSQNSTFPNYIFDVSEWFLNQTSTIGAFLQNTPLVSVAICRSSKSLWFCTVIHFFAW